MRRSTGINAGIGLTQYVYGAAFHGEEVTLLGALSATAFGAIGGLIGGSGARNVSGLAKTLAGSGATKSAINGWVTALRNVNLYSKTLSAKIQEAIYKRFIDSFNMSMIFNIIYSISSWIPQQI